MLLMMMFKIKDDFMLNSLSKKVSSLFSRGDSKEKATKETPAHVPFGQDMTLQDFADQLSMLDKVGSLSKIARFVPGMKDMKVSPEQLQQGKQEAALFKEIIAVMTPLEKKKPAVLTVSRKKQIARDANVRPEQVDLLLSRFEQMQQFAKLMKKSK